MKKILFICSQNKLRSPTAETVFRTYPELEVQSAGMNKDAVNILTSELIEWAEVIFVMEKSHKSKLQKNFKKYLRGQCVIVLNIPDVYDYMDPELVS
jgi:predicted protein tyrosine phosphatase